MLNGHAIWTIAWMILHVWLLFPNPPNGGLISYIRGTELPFPARESHRRLPPGKCQAQLRADAVLSSGAV